MIALYVRTGSRHETHAQNGVSHFLEHLFFRGSVGYPDTVAMNAAVEAAGGSLNGITARDHGCYYTPSTRRRSRPASRFWATSSAARSCGRWTWSAGDPRRDPRRGGRLGPRHRPDNLSKRIIFGSHPLGFKIAGTSRSVEG